MLETTTTGAWNLVHKGKTIANGTFTTDFVLETTPKIVILHSNHFDYHENVVEMIETLSTWIEQDIDFNTQFVSFVLPSFFTDEKLCDEINFDQIFHGTNLVYKDIA